MEKSNKIQFTYLVFDGRYYKIGKSVEPEKRLKSLQTANPKCELIGFTNKVTEKNLHKRFANKRVGREWFDLNEKDLQYIENVFQSGLTWQEERTCDNIDKKTSRQKIYSEYVIGFGKYKGTPIAQMTDNEQISYLQWFVNESRKSLSNKKRRKDIPYCSAKWQLTQLGVGFDVVKEMKTYGYDGNGYSENWKSRV